MMLNKFLRRAVRFVGAHSTGKSTLARWTAQEYRLPLVPEVARTLIGELGKTLDEIRMDPAASEQFQCEIFARQIAAEAKCGGAFVADRACDHLAYAAEHSAAAPWIVEDGRWPVYLQAMRESTVFFVRPHRGLIVADGVRAGVDWDCVVRIDAMIKFILKSNDVPFVELASMDMDARVSTIRGVLGKAPSNGENN